MSKVVITLVDRADGQVDIKTEFDPPLRRAHIATAAQSAACLMIEAIKHANGSTIQLEDFE